jgi:DNA-binding NarL/FixJ family response regulator
MAERPARLWSRSVRAALDADDPRGAADSAASGWPRFLVTDPALVASTVQALPAAERDGRAGLVTALALALDAAPEGAGRASAPLLETQADRLLRRGADRAARAGSPDAESPELDELVIARAALAGLHRRRGCFTEAQAELDRAGRWLDALPGIDAGVLTLLRARLRLERALVAVHRDGMGADRSTAPVSTLTETSMHPADRVTAAGLMALSAFVRDDAAAAEVWIDAAERAAAAEATPRDAAEIPLEESPALAPAVFTAFLIAHDRAELGDAGDTAARLAAIAHGSEWRAYASLAEAMLLLLGSRHTAAAAALADADRLMQDWSGGLLAAVLAAGIRARLDVEQGRPLAAGFEDGRRMDDDRHVLCRAQLAGWSLLSRGGHDGGEGRDARDAAAHAARARQAVASCLAAGPRHAAPGLADALLVDAVAALRQGDDDGAAHSFDEALAVAARSGTRRPFRHPSRADLTVLVRRASARPHPEQVRALLDELRPSTDEAVQLSEREIQVLAGLRRGASVQVLAQELFLSPNTVKTHVRNIYRKLGANDRESAFAAASEHGIALDITPR